MATLAIAAETSAYKITPEDRKFLSQVMTAVEKKDANWIASHTALPVVVTIDGKQRLIEEEGVFSAIVARQLTTKLRDRLRAANRTTPFKNWQGS